VQRAKISAVVGNEGLSDLGGTKENLHVAQPQTTQLLRRVGIQSAGAEQTSNMMRNVFIEREPETWHALRDGSRV
jgi:hypothetical protein